MRTIQAEAGGDINKSRFVKLDLSASPDDFHRLVQATDGAGANAISNLIVGVSDEALREYPIDGGSTLAAVEGDSFRFFPYMEECLVQVSATLPLLATDRWITSDANGLARPALATEMVVAVNWEGAVAVDELARIQVISPFILPA
jgi:hypothetical protein